MIISVLAKSVLDLYIRWFEKKNRCFYPRQLGEAFAGLYPGKNVGKKILEYYRKKTERAIKFGLAGLLIVMICVCKQVMSSDIEDGKYLERQSQGGGEKEFILDAEIGEKTVEGIAVTVGEQELTDTEKRQLLEDVAIHLEEKIKGENESLDNVTSPLNLITEWEDTEVSIDWISENYGILKEDGCFGTDEIPTEGITVGLKAVISLDDMLREKGILVKVFPKKLTEDEQQKSNILKVLNQREKSSRTENYMELPTQFEGKEIIWKEKKDGFGLILLFPFVIVFAVIWGMDRDVHKQFADRNRHLVLEYCEFVSKFGLLIGAGMSSRNAFTKLAADYKKRRTAGGKRRFVYEEVIMMVRKLESGTGEEEAYDYFAKRCNPACYRKLVSIIIRNQKKGTEGLRESLITETRNAFEERKQEAARLGEEAGTKLLLPMMMMMGVVLMIIVIPAYFSFGGI